MTKKLTAFTLAEVLITLGIIGVVAAIIIPTLLNNSQTQQYTSAAKKTFSGLSNATNLILVDNGGNLSNIFSNANVVDTYSGKMNIIKKCSNSTAEGCWPTNWTKGPAPSQVATPGMILSDGTYVVFNFYAFDCSFVHGNAPNACADIFVDTNGTKPPNIGGEDILAFVLYKDRLRLGGTNQDYYDINRASNSYKCNSDGSGIICQLNYFQ